MAGGSQDQGDTQPPAGDNPRATRRGQGAPLEVRGEQHGHETQRNAPAADQEHEPVGAFELLLFGRSLRGEGLFEILQAPGNDFRVARRGVGGFTTIAFNGELRGVELLLELEIVALEIGVGRRVG